MLLCVVRVYNSTLNWLNEPRTLVATGLRSSRLASTHAA